jgi:Na+-transporting methylmalonyl-CoA/oxaloacetate decarboxylase gamma subunit
MHAGNPTTSAAAAAAAAAAAGLAVSIMWLTFTLHPSRRAHCLSSSTACGCSCSVRPSARTGCTGLSCDLAWDIVYAVLWAGVAVLCLLLFGTQAVAAGVAVALSVLAVLVMLMHVVCAVLDSCVRACLQSPGPWAITQPQGQAAAAAMSRAGSGAGAVAYGWYGLRVSDDGSVTELQLHEVL